MQLKFSFDLLLPDVLQNHWEDGGGLDLEAARGNFSGFGGRFPIFLFISPNSERCETEG